MTPEDLAKASAKGIRVLALAWGEDPLTKLDRMEKLFPYPDLQATHTRVREMLVDWGKLATPEDYAEERRAVIAQRRTFIEILRDGDCLSPAVAAKISELEAALVADAGKENSQ